MNEKTYTLIANPNNANEEVDEWIVMGTLNDLRSLLDTPSGIATFNMPQGLLRLDLRRYSTVALIEGAAKKD